MSIIIAVITVCFLIWAIYALGGAFKDKVPEPWRTVITVVLAAIIFFYLVIPLLRQAPLNLP